MVQHRNQPIDSCMRTGGRILKILLRRLHAPDVSGRLSGEWYDGVVTFNVDCQEFLSYIFIALKEFLESASGARNAR